jgi:hypothetical protein
MRKLQEMLVHLKTNKYFVFLRIPKLKNDLYAYEKSSKRSDQPTEK